MTTFTQLHFDRQTGTLQPFLIYNKILMSVVTFGQSFYCHPIKKENRMVEVNYRIHHVTSSTNTGRSCPAANV